MNTNQTQQAAQVCKCWPGNTCHKADTCNDHVVETPAQVSDDSAWAAFQKWRAETDLTATSENPSWATFKAGRASVRAISDADVDAFVEGYECDTGEGIYQPNEHERFLIEDAITTFLATHASQGSKEE